MSRLSGCFQGWLALLYFLHLAVADVSTVIITLAASTTPPSPQYTVPPQFTSAILNSTNTYRLEHNATQVYWNKTLEEYAKQHVAPCQFKHSGGPYGENLAEGYQNVTAAVAAWGDERLQYDFSKGQFGEATGHFTQLVWKSTTSTGCAAISCGGQGYLLFCEYYPAGNIIGHFQPNVQEQVKKYQQIEGQVDASATTPPATTATATATAASSTTTRSSATKNWIGGYETSYWACLGLVWMMFCLL